MKKYLIGLGLTTIVCSVFAFQAPQKPVPAKKKIVFKGQTFFSGGYANGTIPKKVFDSLLSQGLTARDTSNIDRPVLEFECVYAERGLYEDSTGAPLVITDHFSIMSDQGKLPDYWINILKTKTKEGDTATFDAVIATYQDSAHTHFYSAPLRLVITE